MVHAHMTGKFDLDHLPRNFFPERDDILITKKDFQRFKERHPYYPGRFREGRPGRG